MARRLATWRYTNGAPREGMWLPASCDYIEADVILSRPLPAQPEGHRVIINGQYYADNHCVVTSYGEPLVAFETDAGSLAPFDGKAVTVTVRGE